MAQMAMAQMATSSVTRATPTVARSRSGAVRCVASSAAHPQPAAPASRRALLASVGLAAGAALLPGAARARDLAAAEAAKEARRAALRKAADDSAATGVGEAAFAESEYGIGDDHTPNTHTRQDETLRSQSNV